METVDTPERTVLDLAAEATRDRGPKYGHPLDHFRRTALRWTAHLQARGVLPPDRRLEWYDVARMQVEDKASRLDATPEHHDSHVDRCGYVRAEEMGWQELRRRGE
jgi:hypothetical protein